MDEQPDIPSNPEQLREHAWALFRKAAELRLEADELATRASELLKLAAEGDGGPAEP